MPTLRAARPFVLILGALATGSLLGPTAAPARTLEGEGTRRQERVQIREERQHGREERRQARLLSQQEHRKERLLGRELGASQKGLPALSSNEGGSSSARCRISIVASSQRVVLGEGVTLSGKLTCPVSPTAGGQRVTSYKSGAGSPRNAVATVATGPDGSYQLTVPALQRNSMLTVTADGARSARVAVKVAPWVTIADPPAGSQLVGRTTGMHRSASSKTTFSGTVDARFAGRRVALQTSFDAADEQWRTVAIATVGAEGGFAIAHAFRTPGPTWVRVVVHPSKGNVPGASEALSYDVAATQNPALSIESSAPLVSFGQSVSISGIAAGVAQPVQLFARTRRGAFELLASTSSDEAGHYTFVVAPQQTGFYEVRDAAGSSIALLQNVVFQLTVATPPSAAAIDAPVVLDGSFAPASPGDQVELELQHHGIGFSPIAPGTVEGTSFSITHSFSSSGSYRLRVKIQQTGGVEATFSAPFTLTVSASGALNAPEVPSPPAG